MDWNKIGEAIMIFLKTLFLLRKNIFTFWVLILVPSLSCSKTFVYVCKEPYGTTMRVESKADIKKSISLAKESRTNYILNSNAFIIPDRIPIVKLVITINGPNLLISMFGDNYSCIKYISRNHHDDYICDIMGETGLLIHYKNKHNFLWIWQNYYPSNEIIKSRSFFVSCI